MHGTVSRAVLDRSKKSSEFSNKSSDISDAMRLLRIAAEPRPVGDSVKAAVSRVARAFKWSPSRTRDLWYGTARRVEVHEMDALRDLERERDAADFITERRRNLEQVAVLRTRLHMRDADFHAPDIAAIDWILRELK
jgi:hypothetical protein